MDNKVQSRTLRSVRPPEPVQLPVKIKPKGKPVFWWIFGGEALLLCVALAIALSIMDRALNAVEETYPVHAAEVVFNRYFKSGDFTEAFKLCGFEVAGFEDPATVSAALREQGEGRELIYFPASTEEGKVRYNVGYADPVREEMSEEGAIPVRDVHKKIAVMTFVLSDEDHGFGMKGWKLESLEMFLEGSKSVTVTVPRGTNLTLNDRPVPESYIVATEESPNNAFLPEGTPGIYFDQYRVDGLYRDGQIACTDADGNPLKVNREEDGTYSVDLSYRADLQDQYSEFVRKGMEAYACYIQDAGGINEVAKYFDTGSLFYRNTRLNPQQWVITPSSYRFENESIDHFYAYSDDVISCKVDMTQVLVRGGAEYRDHMIMTVFLHRVNGTFRIFDRMILG